MVSQRTGEPWRVKYDGTCSRCGVGLAKGTPAVWDRLTRTIRCIECPSTVVDVPPIDIGIAGRSARVEHERRVAQRNAAITERWGTGFVAKVVRRLSEEPQSTRAWAVGAAGEEKLAEALESVEGLRMLHDRRVPGTRGNIDHILVTRAGVFVVDAKNHKGRIEVRDRGGLFRTDLRLLIGGRDCSALADATAWQVDAVQTVLIAAGTDPLPPITPVLCFLSVEWPILRPPDRFRDVRLANDRSIKRLLASEDRLAADVVDSLVLVLSSALPPR